MKNKKPFLCKLGIHNYITIVSKNAADIKKKADALLILDHNVYDKSVYDYDNWPPSSIIEYLNDYIPDNEHVKVCVNCQKIVDTIKDRLITEYNRLFENKYFEQKAIEIFNKSRGKNT